MIQLSPQTPQLNPQLIVSPFLPQQIPQSHVHIGLVPEPPKKEPPKKEPIQITYGPCGLYNGNAFYKQIMGCDIHSAPSSDIYKNAFMTLKNIEDIDRRKKDEYSNASCALL